MNSKRIFNGLLAAVLGLAALELFTGLLLLPFYKPDSASAYTSAKSIESSLTGSILQSFHHWLSAALIVLGGLTLLYGLVSAAYRMNSKKLWVGAVVLTLLFLMLQLTGHILPWDTHAVRTAVVETGIAQGAPVIGDLQANLLRAGTEVGPKTLQFWYWSHVAILSLLLIVLGVILWKKLQGVERSKRVDGTLKGVVVVVVLALALIAKVQLGPASSASDFSNYDAKPEWYILPMHTLLDLAGKIKPSMAFVGSMVIPGVVVLLVLVAPWTDRRVNPERKSIYGPALGSVLLIGGGVLFFMSAGGMASPNGPNNPAVFATNASSKQTLDPKLVSLGQALVKEQGCNGCHTINGSGGNSGPVLNGTGTRHPDVQWQIKHLLNPQSVTPSSTMPAYSSLSQEQAKEVAEYLASLK